MAASKGWTWAFLLTSLISSSFGCNPEACVDKTHGSYQCDQADSSSYYICDYGSAKHFTCNTGLIWDGNLCNYPTSDPCVPTPVPNPVPGIVVNGICVASETTVSSGNANNTGSSGTDSCTGTGIQIDVYRRLPQKMCACAVHQTLAATSAGDCAGYCLRSSVCTDFNFLTTSSTPDNCELLTCSTGLNPTVSMGYDCYEKM